MPERVRIVHESGRFATVPAENLAEAEKLGWRTETAEDAAQRNKGTWVETVGRQGAAGVAGGLLSVPKAATALGSAVLGTEDPLAELSGRQFVEDIGALTGPDVVQGANQTRAALEADQIARPGTSLAAELGGQLVGSLAYGGAAGAGAARGAAALGLTGRAAGVATGVGAGFLEGGALGATQAAEEAWIRDEVATTEQTLASMGLGSLFGAGVGAAVPLAGAGLARAFGAADDPLRRLSPRSGALFSEVSPEVSALDRVTRKAESKAERWLNPEATAVRQMDQATFEATLKPPRTLTADEVSRDFGITNFSATARSGRRMYAESDEILESTSRKLRGDFEKAVKSTEQITEEVVHRELKREHVATNLANINKREALNWSRVYARELKDVADEIVNDATTYGKSGAANLLEWSKRVSKAVAKGDTVEAYMQVDQARRLLYKRYQSVAASARRASDPLVIEQQTALAGRLKAQYLKAADYLMSPVWGKQGAAQQAANTAWVRYIKAKDAAFDKIATRTGRDIDGLPTYAVDSSKLSSYVKRLGRFESETADEQVREFVAASRNLSEAIGEGYVLPEGKAAAISALRESTEGIAVNLRKADETVRLVNQIDHMVKGAELDRALGNVSPTSIAGTITGGLFGGTPGAIAGAAVGSALNPGAWIPKLARAEDVVRRVMKKTAKDAVDPTQAPESASRVARALRAMIGASDEKAANGVRDFFKRFDAPREGRSRTRRTATGLTSQLTSDNRATRRRAYSDHAKQIAEVNSNPELAAARLADVTGSTLPAVAPRAHARMAMQASKVASYLQSKMPAPARDPNSITPHLDEPPPVSDKDLYDYSQRYEGATEPLSLLEDIARGDVDPLKVEAVRECWPQVYAGIQTKIFAELMTRTKPVPPEARRMLDLVLNANGAIEPTASPEFQATIQMAAESVMQQPQPRGASGTVPRVSKTMQTRSARLAET